jgi:hypothetical protein
LLIVKDRKTTKQRSSAPKILKTGPQNCRLTEEIGLEALKWLFAENCSINQNTFERESS